MSYNQYMQSFREEKPAVVGPLTQASYFNQAEDDFGRRMTMRKSPYRGGGYAYNDGDWIIAQGSPEHYGFYREPANWIAGRKWDSQSDGRGQIFSPEFIGEGWDY